MLDNISYLLRNKLFENISRDIIENFVTSKKSVFFDEGKIIFAKDDPADTIYLVLSGEINLINYNFIDRNRSGSNSKIYSEFSFFGYDEISARCSRFSTAIALTKSELLIITKDELDYLITKSIRILENLSKNILENEMHDIDNDSIKRNEETRDEIIKEIQIPKFSFRGKVEKPSHIENEQRNINLELDELLRQKESLEKEKEFAEKAISEEMNTISEKEKELSKLEASLMAEKKLAEAAVSQEFDELKRKETQVKQLEQTIFNKKKNAEKFIQEKLAEIRKKEAALSKKHLSIEEGKKLLETAIEKTKELAEKEMELLKKSSELEKEYKRIEEIKTKEDLLAKREKEIQETLLQIEEEKKIADKTFEKEKEIQQKEIEIQKTLAKLKEEKLILEGAEAMQEEIRNKEEELKKRTRELEDEKSEHENRLKQQFDELRSKEMELLKREENLKREQELASITLQKQFDELEEKEKMLNELFTKQSNINNDELDFYKKQVAEMERKQKELLTIIERLKEKEQTRYQPEIEPEKPIYESLYDKVESIPEEKLENIVEDNPPQKEEIVIDNVSPTAYTIERDFEKMFQVEEFEDIKIMLVNLQRATADVANDFSEELLTVLLGGAKKIIVDITFCDFLDSTFLGAMVKFLKKLTYEGGMLKIVVDMEKLVTSTFFISGMDRVFKIYEDIDTAVREFI